MINISNYMPAFEITEKDLMIMSEKNKSDKYRLSLIEKFNRDNQLWVAEEKIRREKEMQVLQDRFNYINFENQTQ